MHNNPRRPFSEHFADVVHHTLSAKRHDLVRMLERTDVLSLARDTMSACEALLDVDVDIDVVLMVGVGAANAGELVSEGKGIAFVCLEHFTAVASEDTQAIWPTAFRRTRPRCRVMCFRPGRDMTWGAGWSSVP